MRKFVAFNIFLLSLTAFAANAQPIVLLRQDSLRYRPVVPLPGNAKISNTNAGASPDVKKPEESSYATGTADSIEVSAYAPYNDVSKMHRSLFGENYRKEWAASVKLPVLRISEMKGGLVPIKEGGGHQTLSVRLEDKTGKEWVVRSIRKYPDVLLPESLRETFAKDILRDAMTAQHPYAPLIVPVLADAVNVPHTNPVIGYIAPDEQVGPFEKTFAKTVCLFEEREPSGNSDNTPKMLEELNKDNDNSIDSVAFLRARLLDLFLADWDRHDDQWRWYDEKKGSEKKYLAIPRDRDQALYRNEGFFPSIASQRAIAPFLKGFKPKIKLSNEFFLNGQTLDNRFLNQLSHDEWMKTTNDFISALTDDVFEKALRKLPQVCYEIRHDELLAIMKQRRENLAAASEKYYFFLNKFADIRLSDKNELVEISDGPDGGLLLVIHKISKERKVREQLFSKNFLPSVTKEIRIFMAKGDDSVVINTKQTSVKVRIVGGDGDKDYNVINARKKMKVYEKETNASFEGMIQRLRKHLSNDSANIAIVPTRRYNITVPLVTVGFNPDDGVFLGLSLKHTHQGFRKIPYASVQQFNIAHSFSTNAFRIGYRGEWWGATVRRTFCYML